MKRPAPADFLKVYTKLQTIAATSRHYTASTKTVNKWIAETGIERIKPDNRPKPPKNFAENREVMNAKDLRKHYGVGAKTIAYWVSVLGLPPKIVAPPPKPRRDMPDDFIYWANRSTAAELANRYKADYRAVRRWLKETGITPRPPHKANFRLPKLGTDVPPPKGDMPWHKAANYLRKYAPVSVCDDAGRYRENGEFYRYGQNIYTRQDLVAKAKRLGLVDASV